MTARGMPVVKNHQINSDFGFNIPLVPSFTFEVARKTQHTCKKERTSIIISSNFFLFRLLAAGGNLIT